MAAVSPGEELGPLNPKLDAFTATNLDRAADPTAQLGPLLADPFALAFQVFDVRNEDAAAGQVWPTTPDERQAVDLDADKIGTGHFAAAFTVPELGVGRYEVRWFLEQEEGAAARTWRRPFEVLANTFDDGTDEAFALVVDVRDEGIGADVKNRRIVGALAQASEMIRRWTGRDFVPRYKSIKIDALRSGAVLLDEPICAVESVRLGVDEPIDRDSFRVYARHLTQGLLDPDDRDAPRIEFVRRRGRDSLSYGYPVAVSVDNFRELRAPRLTNSQEITISGVFGFTAPERAGCPVGVTPAAIRRATVLLAMRELPKAGSDAEGAFDARNAYRVKSVRTREQSIEWGASGSPAGAAGAAAPFTGDPAIDTILLTYVRPLSGTGL